MSALTIDDLKSALISKGIKIPLNSRKDAYIKLYQEHVAPLRNVKISENFHQFSSDEEDTSVQTSVSKSKITTGMSENSFQDLGVLSLPDEELYDRLSNMGVSVGPIVDSTRKIYQRRLIRLMGGDVSDSFNGELPYDDEYSNSESDAVDSGTLTQGHSEKNVKSNSPKQSSSPHLRLRETTDKNYGMSSNFQNSLSFDHDRHTPSPRPSLRTVTSSASSKTTTYVTSGGNLRETTSTRYVYGTSTKEEEAAAQKKNYAMRLLVKFTFILVLIAVLFFLYQYMYSESPFKGLENLAQEALDSANEDSKMQPKTASKS